LSLDDGPRAKTKPHRAAVSSRVQAISEKFGGDISAGFLAGVTAIPTALATALLVFGQLGASVLHSSASVAIYSLIIGGVIVALLANSSPIVPVPIIGPNLMFASLVAIIASAHSGAPDLLILITAALGLCMLIAGLGQVCLGASGLAAIGNFVPYPVLVGFLNGIAVLTMVSQLRPHFAGAADLDFTPTNPTALAFVTALVALIFFFPSLARALRRFVAVPGALAALVFGIAAFQAANWLWPSFDLGPALGRLDVPLVPSFALSTLAADTWPRLQALLPVIVAHSVAALGVATIETFLTMRLVQNAIDTRFSPRRQMVSFGLANSAVGAAGGLILSGQPSLTMMAVGAGGRTRLTPLVMAMTVLLFGVAYSDALAVIPVAVLSAILIATSLRLFDPWTFRLVRGLFAPGSRELRLRTMYDLLVVACVMAMTIFYSVIGGIVLGCVLAGLIFIVRMSQPVVRATFWDSQVRSKRVRTALEEGVLAASPRAVLKLQGVIFFGNASDLAERLKTVEDKASIIVLDCKRITDIDVSGANTLRATLERARRQGTKLHFCNVPNALVDALVIALEMSREDLVRDLDSTLTQVEDDILRAVAPRTPDRALTLDRIDFLRDLAAHEIALLDGKMPLRHFGPGDVVCREGEPSDRMWLVLRGSVSATVAVGDRVHRLACLGPGTVFGEMSLIERGTRSADVIADGDVVCRELSRDTVDEICRDHPGLAASLLRSVAQALALRVRSTSADLRLVLDEFV